MVYTLGYIWGKWGGHVYKIRAMGEGATYREHKILWVSFSECGVTVAQSYLNQHMASLHRLCVPQTRWVDKKGEVPTTYVMSFPHILQPVRCPVLGCPVKVHSAGRLRGNFMFRKIWSQIEVVREER